MSLLRYAGTNKVTLIVFSALLLSVAIGCREQEHVETPVVTLTRQGVSDSGQEAQSGGNLPQRTVTAAPYPYPPLVGVPTQAYPGGTPTQEVWTPPPTFTPPPTQTPSPPTVTPLPTVDVAALSTEAVGEMSVWRALEGERPHAVLQASDTPLGVDEARWSPDGSRLLVDMVLGEVDPMMSWAETTPVVLAPEGSGWHVGGRGNNPCATYNAWSPDGAQLAYIAGGDVWAGGNVWLANADGSGARILPSPPESGPTALQFSPRGDRLAVLVGRRQNDRYLHDLWLYDTVGDAQTLLIGGADAGAGGVFSWSPGGDAVAYLGGTYEPAPAYLTARLWIVEVTRSGAGQVIFADLDEIPATEGCLSRPQWALGGEKVLARVLLKHGVWVMDRNGEVQRMPSEGEPARHGSTFSLAPDGRYVAYTGGTTDPIKDSLIYDLATEQVVARLPYTADLGLWSPVAPQLFFNAPGGGLMLLDMVQDQTVTVDSASLHGVDLPMPGAWSPDGSRFAYWRPEPGGYGLWLWSAEEEPVLLLQSVEPAWGQRNPYYVYDMTPQWRPDGQALAVVAILASQPEVYIIEAP